MSDQVRFNLWAVLTFLFVAGAATAGFLYAEGKETKMVQRTVLERMTKVETQFDYITCGINELKAGQKELTAALKAHENRNGVRK
jgi:hypothetical protein